jgi:phage gp36-like protein
MATAYIAQSDLEARFGVERVAQVFSVIQPTGSYSSSADSTAVAAGIADGCAELDELLGVVYVTPFAPLPGGGYDGAIVEIACIFTMFRAALRRVEYDPTQKDAPGLYERPYRLALKRCEEIKLDKRRLQNQTAIVPANIGGQFTNSAPDTVQQDSGMYFSATSAGQGGFNNGIF